MKGILWLELLDTSALPTQRYPELPTNPHVTLQYNCDYEPYRQHMGQIVVCRLLEEFYNDRVQAVRVKICDPVFAELCKNPVPHVSVSKQPEAFFKESGTVYDIAVKHEYLATPQRVQTVVFFQPFALFKDAAPGTYRPDTTVQPVADSAGQDQPS